MMSKKWRQVPRPPWITENGCLDLGKLPIDGILRQSLSEDDKEALPAWQLLSAMAGSGRAEAGIYLVGLFHHVRDDLKKLTEIVRLLPKNELTAQLLLSEFRRVKSSNSTRRYLDAVLKALAGLPLALVDEGLESLCEDGAFSVRMRAKFRSYLERLRYSYERY